ncbi:MAG: DUF29 family protein [Alphaproteobacteria bacterium]|nr:MAG: DUF29 family protein [Alphaproteobacteria bacterium]
MFRWEASVPEGLRIRERHEDAYAWALAQAARLRRGGAGLKGLDRAELSDFLEEWAEEMLSGARSQLVNLMAHAAKVARSRNPAVIGHWRSECVEFHDRLIEEYRASMRDRIDIASLGDGPAAKSKQASPTTANRLPHCRPIAPSLSTS